MKIGRATAVSSTVNVSAVMLNAKGHESPSARNEIGFINNVFGCHDGKASSNGICASQINTLIMASIAPPTPASHAYWVFGWVTRSTTNASAVIKRSRQEIKINMGETIVSVLLPRYFALLRLVQSNI